MSGLNYHRLLVCNVLFAFLAHSPDNTFLGFVVDSKSHVPKSVIKKNYALTYGKHYYMWKVCNLLLFSYHSCKRKNDIGDNGIFYRI